MEITITKPNDLEQTLIEVAERDKVTPERWARRKLLAYLNSEAKQAVFHKVERANVKSVKDIAVAVDTIIANETPIINSD